MFKKSLFLLFLTILFLSFTQAASESHVIDVYQISRDDLGDYATISEFKGNGSDIDEVVVCNKLREGSSCNIGKAEVKIEEITFQEGTFRNLGVKMRAVNEGTSFDVIYEKNGGNYINLKAEEDLPLEKASFVVRKPNGSPIEKFTFGWENEEAVFIESERYRPDEHGFDFSAGNFIELGQDRGFVATGDLILENVGGVGLTLISGNTTIIPNVFSQTGGISDDEWLAVSHTDLLDYRNVVQGNPFHIYAIISWKGPTDQHTACVNKQCVIVEGVGENECRIDRDCKLSKGNTPGTPGIMFSPPAEGVECNWFQKIFFKSRC